MGKRNKSGWRSPRYSETQSGIQRNGWEGDQEGAGSLFLTDAYNLHTGLPKPYRQPCKIAVARYYAETVSVSRVKDVHRIDYHSRVRAVFSRRITVLLYGGYCVFKQRHFPAADVGRGPVSVYAFYGGSAVYGYLLHHSLYTVARNVVGVNQHGKPEILKICFICHLSTSLRFCYQDSIALQAPSDNLTTE